MLVGDCPQILDEFCPGAIIHLVATELDDADAHSPTVVRLPADPLELLAGPGARLKVDERLFTPFRDLKAVLAKEPRVFLGHVEKCDEEPVRSRKLDKFAQ